jgi:hypothetical protein
MPRVPIGRGGDTEEATGLTMGRGWSDVVGRSPGLQDFLDTEAGEGPKASAGSALPHLTSRVLVR